MQVSLKNQFVVAVDQITLKNAGKAPVSTFQWCTLEGHIPHLAYLSVSLWPCCALDVVCGLRHNMRLQSSAQYV